MVNSMEKILEMWGKLIVEDEKEVSEEWFEPGPLYTEIGFVALRYNKETKHTLEGKFADGKIFIDLYISKVELND